MSGSKSEVRMLAHFTLAMLLFSEAAGIKLEELKKSSALPLRMLLGGYHQNRAMLALFKDLITHKPPAGVTGTALKPSKRIFASLVLLNGIVQQTISIPNTYYLD